MDRDQWEEILESLGKNRTRTFLTAFGIFWGIFMLILLMGGGRGLENMLKQNFSGFATNSGFIITSKTSKEYKGFKRGRWWWLTLNDVERVRRCVPEVDVCTPVLMRWGSTAVRDNRSCSVSMVGEMPEYDVVYDPKIKFGRALNEKDNLQQRKVCVLGSRVVEELFPELLANQSPCGEFVQVDGIYYRVVGVSGCGDEGINIGGNPTTQIRLPFQTMRVAYNRGNNVDLLCLTARSSFRMSDVQNRVESVLKHTHMIHPEDTQAVQKLNTEALFGMVDTLFQGISVLVWMIGLGTLMAGAIGVSNIMVITVKERTCEIGIRRAIGATPKDILQMVMSESVLLTLLAGMGGLVSAVLILQAMEHGIKDTQFQISFSLAVGAAVLLALLGVIAGLVPAFRAMKIKPVDAMREE